MDVFLGVLVKFIESVWSATDPFGVAFAIIGTYGFRSLDAYGEGDPPDKKDRTTIQRILPLIPVFLGMAWVVMFSLIVRGDMNIGPLSQRAVGTGCSALAVHKVWWHTIKNT